MPHNLIKNYNSYLEIGHYNSYQRDGSLRAVFDRDISNNENFKFRSKIIRPLKKEGEPSLDTLFGHLTRETNYETDDKGKVIKSRNDFDIERSKRIHWIWNHIRERNPDKIEVFSHPDRIKGKTVIRTYIFDKVENYVVILEPQRSNTDYYLITAYYLKKERGGPKQIRNKLKKKLAEVY